MKHLIIALVTLASVAAYAQLGVDAMAIQRAKNVANQNNNRSLDPAAYSGVPTARPTPAPAVPAAAPLTPGQQAYSRFQSSFFSLNPNSSADAKQSFARNLASVAQGTKPSETSATKLSDHLALAVGEAKLTSAKKTRVAQEVARLLNSGNMPPSQAQAMIKDVQSTLETGGSSSDNAATVAADLQSVTDEIQKPAAK